MRSILKNKRGDITTTILVVGVFAVCALAIIVFFLTSLKVASNFIDVGLIEKVSSRVEKFEPGDAPDGYEERGNVNAPYFIETKLAREHWYSLTKTKEVFSVKKYLPQ